MPSRWKVLSGEFRRRPTSLAGKLRKSDRVGRRGLFEPREDFSRLITNVFPWLDSVGHLFAYPAVNKFCRASSAGPPAALAIKFSKTDRVDRRGLFTTEYLRD